MASSWEQSAPPSEDLLIEHFHPCLLCRARKNAECESLPRVLFRLRRLQSVVPERIQGHAHQRVRNANAGHDLRRARPQQTISHFHPSL